METAQRTDHRVPAPPAVLAGQPADLAESRVDLGEACRIRTDGACEASQFLSNGSDGLGGVQRHVGEGVDGVRIENNYIGTDISGTIAVPNQGDNDLTEAGILVASSTGTVTLLEPDKGERLCSSVRVRSPRLVRCTCPLSQ